MFILFYCNLLEAIQRHSKLNAGRYFIQYNDDVSSK